MSAADPPIEPDDFLRVDLRVGRVVRAERHARARVSAYVLEVDLGPEFGVRRSSAQLTENYAPEDLEGRLVVAVVNLAAKRVAGVKSEVLVLGAVDDSAGTVLLVPERDVPLGARVR